MVGGEGIRGVTGPLLAAGARSLVATQWRIDDREVVPVVDAFYAALASGQPVIEALRTAKLRALGDGRSPRAWAAFSSVGDPLVTVSLRKPPVHWWLSLER